MWPGLHCIPHRFFTWHFPQIFHRLLRQHSFRGTTMHLIHGIRCVNTCAGLLQTVRLLRDSDPQISRRRHMTMVRSSALRTSKHYTPPPPHTRKYSWYSFLLIKMPMTPSGIETATFRLNQLCHRVPLHTWYSGCNLRWTPTVILFIALSTCSNFLWIFIPNLPQHHLVRTTHKIPILQIGRSFFFRLQFESSSYTLRGPRQCMYKWTVELFASLL